jgi:MFS family permease
MAARDEPLAAAVSPAPATARRGVAALVDLRTFTALHDRHYRMLWLGMLFAFMTMNMQQVARGWLAYELTGSAATLAIVAISWGAPMVVFSLPGGVAADRFEKKFVMMASQLAGAVAAVVIALLVAFDLIEIWHLVLAGVVQGTGFAFNLPARQAIIRELVPDDGLINAIALNNAGMNLMRIVGPSIAGLMIAAPGFGVKGVYFFMAGLYVAAAVILAQLPRTRAQRLAREGRSAEAPGSPLGQIRAGLAYIAGNAPVRTLIVLAFVPILIGFPYQILLPVMAESPDGLDIGARGLGAMWAIIGAGALTGSLVVASLGAFRRRALMQAFVGVALGLALLGLAGAPTLLVAIPALLVLGFAADSYSSLNSTMIMTNTDPRFHGRVMSVYLMTFAAMPIGAAPVSALADAIGVRETFAIMGAVVAGFVALVAVGYPRYRRIT